MRLQTKLVILFLLMVILPMMFLSTFLIENAHDISKKKVSQNLIGISELKKAELEMFFDDVSKDVLFQSESDKIIDSVVILSKPAGAASSNELNSSKETLFDTFVSHNSKFGIISVDIFDRFGNMIYQQGAENNNGLNLSYDSEAVFRNTKRGNVLFEDIYDDNINPQKMLGVLASAPVYDDTDRLIGFVVYKISINRVNLIASNFNGLGETGEIIYSTAKANKIIFLFQPRNYTGASFEGDFVLGSQYGIATQNALKKEVGFGEIIDYRRVESVASWNYISQTGWGLVVKVDKKEVYAEVDNLVNATIIIIITFCIFIGLLIFVLSRSIAMPINNLSKSISLITKGQFDVQIKRSELTEIAGLGDSIERILSSLKLAMLHYDISKEELMLDDAVKLKKKAEKEFEMEKIFLENLINTLPDPIFVKDRQHKWILLNNAFCKFMGYRREILLGKSDYDFFPKKEADVFWKKDELVFTTGKENVNTENFTDAKGQTHKITTTKRLCSYGEGEYVIVGLIKEE